jgi:hypothetical protein
MEPFNERLHETIMDRWHRLDRSEQVFVISYLAADRPTAVVRAMDNAQRLAREVEETLSQ